MSQTDTEQAESHNADILRDAQKMMYNGKFTEAYDVLQPVIYSNPSHVDALYMVAVCQRYMSQNEQAIGT